MYVHVQVIQNCTTFSRVHIYDMDGKEQDVKQRKRKPGKHCVVPFCHKTVMQTDQPSPVSSNPGCWSIHLASFCNCNYI